MILSGGKILDLVKEKKLIENFSPECIGGAGYDLRVGKVYKLKILGEREGFIGVSTQINSEVEEIPFEKYSLQPNEYVLVESIEKVNIPKNLVGRILPRSSVFRLGCALLTAVVDPGFQGTLTMGLKNLSPGKKFTFQKGARIAQIIFEEILGKAKSYEGRYQGGKVI
jgi:deoxycytidine triphosphate deaminase